MMKATRTFNNGLYQENLYQAYYNTPAEKHVVSESLEQEAMPVLVSRKRVSVRNVMDNLLASL